MIARWLATSRKVLLLDEPTRGIDVGAKAEVQALIDELAHEGLAIVLVSSEVERCRVGRLVLRDGSIGAPGRRRRGRARGPRGVTGQT